MRDAIRGTMLVLTMSVILGGSVWALTGSRPIAGAFWLSAHYVFVPVADRMLYPRDRWRGKQTLDLLK